MPFPHLVTNFEDMIRRRFFLKILLIIPTVVACRDGIDTAGDGGPDGGTDSGGGVHAPVDESLEVFASDALPRFYLTLSDEAVAALEQDPMVYQQGGFEYVSGDTGRTIVVDNVGIRLKGRASFQPIGDKPGFKIKFSEFVSKQRFLGLRRLTLNNMVQDPAMARERLGYRFFRAVGAPAPRCHHAEVFVNGEYYGLYANVESLDESFLDRHFSKPFGNLFDTSNEEYFVDMVPGNEYLFELETNQEINDTSDLSQLIEVLDGPEGTFLHDVETVVDLDEFLLLGAAQAIIADWDGYFGASNNYKIYHGGNGFVLLPWGIDQTFNIIDNQYTMLDYRIDGTSSRRDNGVVFAKCKQDDGCRSRYLDRVAEALDVFERIDLEHELDAVLTQIEDAAGRDARRPYAESDIDYSIQKVREFITERPDIVREQLAQ